MLDGDSALALYRAARAAYPDYLPAQADYISLMDPRLAWAELKREFTDSRAKSGIAACLAALMTGPLQGRQRHDLLRALAHRDGDSACTDLYLPRTVGESVRDALLHSARAVREAPMLAEAWEHYAYYLHKAGQRRQEESVLREAIRHVDDPISRVKLMLALADGRLERGDTAGALALRSVVAAVVRRDGRPGLRFWYERHLCRSWKPDQEPECLRLPEMARRARDWFGEWTAVQMIGKTLLERGGPAAALPYLNREVKLADSAGSSGLRLQSLTDRGRAYAKLGRLAPAERDLRRAIAVGARSQNLYLLAEAYHNLAHAYEGAARFAEAAGAADTFVAVTEEGPLYASRVMSHHDAGMIRWEAGWHAAA